MNQDLFKFEDKLTMKSCFFKSVSAYFKPGYTACFTGEPFEKILFKLEDFEESSKKTPLSNAELREIYNKTKALFQKNYFILSELKKDTVTTLKKNIISSFYNV